MAIAETLQEMSGELVDAIDPSETACHLFGYGIISIDECNAATLEATCKKQRSTDLILILIRKLKKEPLWLKDACKALDNTGAHSVVERLQGILSTYNVDGHARIRKNTVVLYTCSYTRKRLS